MYLVSPDYLSTVTSLPLLPAKVRKAPKAEKKHTSSKRRRSAKKIKSKKKKDTPQREHDRCATQRLAARRMISLLKYVLNCMRRMSKERDINTADDFLKQVLPPTTTTTTTSSSAQRGVSHSQTEHVPPVKPDPPFLVQSPQNDAV